MAPSKIGGLGGSDPRSMFHSPAYMPLKMTDSMRYSDNPLHLLFHPRFEELAGF